MLLLIGVYCYAATKNEKANESVGEYVLQNEGIKKLDTIRLSIVDIDTLDPISSNNQNVQDIAKLIFEPLLELDENYKIQLRLAKEWAKLNDLEYIIKLKGDIIWHDGRKFNSQDVKYTIDKIKEKQENSIYYSNVEQIKEVIIIDDSTIKIILNEKISFFEYQLTFPIISSSSYDSTNFIGTGKYQITEYTNEKIKIEKWNKWWEVNKEKDNNIIENINVYMYNTMGEAYQAFKDHEIDLLVTSNIDVEDNIGNMGFYSKQFISRQYDFIACNMKNYILNKKEVREAIDCAINKQAIIEKIYRNKYKLANSPLDYSNYLSIDQTEENYNPDKAKEILSRSWMATARW